MIDWLQSILDWYMQNVNYWSVLVCMTIESSIIPFPAELIVPPAAWKAANGGSQFPTGSYFQHNRIGSRRPLQLRVSIHVRA